MLLRLSAAVCGAGIVFLCCSAAMARTEINPGHPHAVDRTAFAGSIVGTASMYNPFRPGYRGGSGQTASGERYDPHAWSAAIQMKLRGSFGGVHFGRSNSYALIESMNRKAIVKINDVGPLEPGRIIDFNERTMRYFDGSLRRGLIRNVKVMPLHGSGWTLGPVAKG